MKTIIFILLQTVLWRQSSLSSVQQREIRDKVQSISGVVIENVTRYRSKSSDPGMEVMVIVHNKKRYVVTIKDYHAGGFSLTPTQCKIKVSNLIRNSNGSKYK